LSEKIGEFFPAKIARVAGVADPAPNPLNPFWPQKTQNWFGLPSRVSRAAIAASKASLAHGYFCDFLWQKPDRALVEKSSSDRGERSQRIA
jgi:hypothetical protein